MSLGAVNTITIEIHEADDGAYISILGTMRVVEMMAVSYLLLKRAQQESIERLKGAVDALKEILDSVKRIQDEEYPGRIVDLKN